MEANAAGMFDWHLGLQDSKQEDTEERTPFLQRQSEHAESDEAGQDWG